MKGSCLCKAVQYEVASLDTEIVHCACSTCRKAHAAAFNTGAGVRPENFKWISGKDTLTSYQSSPGKQRFFCSRCGSQLLAIREGAPHYVLRVATLDEDPGLKPVYRIWTSHQVPWLEYEAEMPGYDEWQPGR